ncbi:MAG: heme exporter protein CcmB [Rhodospirillaceae bacterium]|nr:heme exporter protein CcmB [Rhodospirillaceae bacterium]|tara:strand:+ start:5522 stop:6187 length:666 start_codon:yes stop_codon:yes gene_type:complete
MSVFLALLVRDLRLAVRQSSDGVTVLSFYIIAIVLFPLGLGPDPQTLASLAPGLLCVAALLAAILSLEGLFRSDYEDGSLELMAVSPNDLAIQVFAKIAAHWITTGLPLILVTPFLALLLNLPVQAFLALMLAMVLATPSLSLIGAVGASLTVGARRSGVLISVLVLPLYIPVLIFAVSAIDAVLLTHSPKPHLMLLGAIFAAALPLCTIASTIALRQALE